MAKRPNLKWLIGAAVVVLVVAGGIPSPEANRLLASLSFIAPMPRTTAATAAHL